MVGPRRPRSVAGWINATFRHWSLLPAVIDSAGPVYFTWAALLGTVQLGFAAWFLVNQNERTARLLLRATLIYLPSLLLMLMLGPFS